MKIELVRVKQEEKETLFRLLQYSLFEESLTDLGEMNDDALFDYPWFDAYFIEPQREAYFIREEGPRKLLGFAMVRGCEDDRHAIAEFMVIPKYRRLGVGAQAARACLALHDGLWEVKPSYGSEGAKLFWQAVVSQINADAEWIDDRFELTIPAKEAN